MKILIVDDTPQRYSRLIPLLESCGTDRSAIEFAVCTNDARSKLEGIYYDLVVVDILVPLWPDSDADSQHSIDFLAEMIEGDDLTRPGHIVGISADPSAATKALPAFSSYLWTVVAYSESDDEWLTQLINCVQYIGESKAGKAVPEHQVDLLVVCALSEPELSEVVRLPWGFKAARPIDDLTFVHEGQFSCGGRAYTVAAVSAARMGMISAGLTVSRVIERLRPRLVAMTGICAGVQGKANLGDVIFADPCWDWQSGKYLREADDSASFAIAPHQLGPTAAARAHIEQIRADRPFLAAISVEGPDEPPAVPKIIIGPMASGSAVIADAEIVSEIKSQNREVCGIEMECYGVFAAVENATAPKPKALALKAVCDFANPHKNDKIQRYAAYASARVMRELMERYFDRLVN